MTMKPNQFQFKNARKTDGMTVLNAVMSDFSYSPHAHEDIALGVTLEGIQEFSCNGKGFKSNPGNIILFNAEDVHDGNPGGDSTLKYTMLYINPREFLPLMASTVQIFDTDLRFPETNFEDTTLQHLILEISNLVAGNDTTSFQYEHCLYRIAKRLTQRMGRFHPDAWRKNKDKLLLRARDYIHDNVENDISINDLSKVANISKFHFIRLFRSQFGLTPHQYILNHKINRAKLALKSGRPPSHVAQDFGFFDVSHLNRHFKRSFGITPKQYQHQLATQR